MDDRSKSAMTMPNTTHARNQEEETTMKTLRCSARARAGWMTVLTLCGVLCATTVAQAQPLKIGTVLGVPVSELDSFRRANTTIGKGIAGDLVPANDVTVLHISSVAGEPIHSAIATVSITRSDNGQKAWRVFFPQNLDGSVSSSYRLINAGDVFTNPVHLVTRAGAVVQMDVRQAPTEEIDMERVRFLLLPSFAYATLQNDNPKARITVLHTQQMTNNFGAFAVQLVAVDLDHARQLKIPSSLGGTIRALNTNLQPLGGSLAEVR